MASRSDVTRPLRRVPVQARSRERVDAILAAAAKVFVTKGFAGASVEEIAAQAETSVASVYQFFSNKAAIFETLTEQCLARSQAIFAALPLEKSSSRPWAQVLDDVIDFYVTHELRDPAFRAVWLNLSVVPGFVESGAKLHASYIKSTAAFVHAQAPHLTRQRAQLLATMVVRMLTASLMMAAREKPAAAAELIEETRMMLRRYLEPWMEGTAG